MHWWASKQIIFNTKVDEEPVKCQEDRIDVLKFTHPLKDPGSTIFNVLDLLKALTRDPNEEYITVVQPGGDKGVDQPFGNTEGK